MNLERMFRNPGFWAAQYCFAVLKLAGYQLGPIERRYYIKHAKAIEDYIIPQLRRGMEDNCRIAIMTDEVVRLIRAFRRLRMHKKG